MTIRPPSILLLALLFGCSQTDNPPAMDSAPAPADIPGIILCTDPRPEICTQQYAPVCGVHRDGTRKTYSNTCMACADAEVVGSLPGECPIVRDETPR